MSPPFIFRFCVLSVVQVPIAQAATFKPNCTLPTSSTNFVAAPNTRGTLSILWNCLSVIILCTWNIQHLNIPSRRPYYDASGKKYSWFKMTWWGIVDTGADLKWMLLTILVPEYIVGRALSERLAAASSLVALRSRFGEEMEMVHAYIMNMGGYYLDFSEVGFFGVDIANVNSSGSTGLGSTLVDYSGAHFSGHQVNKDSQQLHNTLNPRSSLGNDLSVPTLSSHGPEPFKLPNHKQENAKDEKEVISNTGESSQSACIAESFSRGVATPDLDNNSGRSQLAEAPPRKESKKLRSVPSRSSTEQIPIGSLSEFQILNLSRFKHEAWALTALQLLSAKGFKLYHDLPSISPQDLEALGNSDPLVKLLAVAQISWLIIQLLVRYRNNIVSSQLEIATLSFSVCSMLTYAMLWNRPRGVTTRYRIKAAKAPKEDEILLLATFGPGYLWTWNRFQGSEDEELHLMPIPNDASHAVDVRTLFAGFEDTVVVRMLVEWLRHNHPAVVSVIAGSVFGGSLFGALHCLAWNFSFPTQTELALWRTSSILTTVLPPLSVYFDLQWSHYNGWVEPLEVTTKRRLHGPILLVCFILPYILARIFLLFEMFWSLFFLPPEAFVDTWPGGFLLWG
ncbi:hypothetical protein B0O99DRAFT_636669 [Bisporella sp. PMI_857]|nr:hypothetical protein B0O99DRAFT_636669 [Bisporella sp. PMI_857]